MRIQPLTLEELAERVGVPYRTIWREVRQGAIRAHKIGRRLYIPVSEADRLGLLLPEERGEN